MKGNSGRAKRSRQLRKLATVIGICLSIILIYEMTGVPKERRRKSKSLRKQDVTGYMPKPPKSHGHAKIT
jgi:hypothetical protein